MSMKKFYLVVLMAMVAIAFSSIAEAATFFAPKGSEIIGLVNGDTVTLTIKGMNIKYVEQYRHSNADGKGFIIRHPAVNGSVTFDVYTGDRFQVINNEGKFLFISPELGAARYSPIKFSGIVIDCMNPKGCCLQVK